MDGTTQRDFLRLISTLHTCTVHRQIDNSENLILGLETFTDPRVSLDGHVRCVSTVYIEDKK